MAESRMHERAITAVCLVLFVLTTVLYAANSVVPKKKRQKTSVVVAQTITPTSETVEKEKKPKKRTVKPKKTVVAVAFPLDLNTATVAQLCQVKGIGESTAQAIIGYRETHGKFSTVEELMKVKGIGKKKFESFSQYFIVKEKAQDQLEEKEL